MIAIRLKQENWHKILNESPILEPDLRVMIEEYGPHPDHETARQPYYFVPKGDKDDVAERNTWIGYTGSFLDEHYDYDHDKIENEFVTITAK